jgi:hypothetical protein
LPKKNLHPSGSIFFGQTFTALNLVNYEKSVRKKEKIITKIYIKLTPSKVIFKSSKIL